jgi:thioredoxin-dependent peroxiredoxin
VAHLRMLKPGDAAPAFELEDDSGRRVRLAELLAAGPLLLFFYPKDFTLICTRQAQMFRKEHEELRAHGVGVAGISPQSSASHARFREQLNLPFPLLADPQKSVIRDYGALGLFGRVKRVSYAIGQDGTIVDAVKADLSVERHRAFATDCARRRGARHSAMKRTQ